MANEDLEYNPFYLALQVTLIVYSTAKLDT